MACTHQIDTNDVHGTIIGKERKRIYIANTPRLPFLRKHSPDGATSNPN